MSYLWMSCFKVGHFTPALNLTCSFRLFVAVLRKYMTSVYKGEITLTTANG